MKKILWVAVLVGLMTGAVAQGALLYQSNFTGADLASAGLEMGGPVNGGYWTLNTANDRVQHGGTVASSRSHLLSTNSWKSTGGFQVDVTFLYNGTSWGEFGLSATNGTTLSGNPSLQNNANMYGVGFALSGGTVSAFERNINNVNEVVLSTAQGAYNVNALNTMLFTVTSNTWSYSLNGAAATAGTFATPFDLSKNYRFDAFMQSMASYQISNITVSSIPEPATIGMLGLGAIVTLLIRRMRA